MKRRKNDQQRNPTASALEELPVSLSQSAQEQRRGHPCQRGSGGPPIGATCTRESSSREPPLDRRSANPPSRRQRGARTLAVLYTHAARAGGSTGPGRGVTSGLHLLRRPNSGGEAGDVVRPPRTGRATVGLRKDLVPRDRRRSPPPLSDGRVRAPCLAPSWCLPPLRSVAPANECLPRPTPVSSRRSASKTR